MSASTLWLNNLWSGHNSSKWATSFIKQTAAAAATALENLMNSDSFHSWLAGWVGNSNSDGMYAIMGKQDNDLQPVSAGVRHLTKFIGVFSRQKLCPNTHKNNLSEIYAKIFWHGSRGKHCNETFFLSLQLVCSEELWIKRRSCYHTSHVAQLLFAIKYLMLLRSPKSGLKNNQPLEVKEEARLHFADSQPVGCSHYRDVE